MWARLDDKFYDHPKLLDVGLAGRGLYVSGLAYCARHLTDGRIPDSWVVSQVAGAEDATLPQKLEAAGLWVRLDDATWHVPGYLKDGRNWSRARCEAESEKKSAAGKKGAAARRKSVEDAA